jgi:hypothetical protein
MFAYCSSGFQQRSNGNLYCQQPVDQLSPELLATQIQPYLSTASGAEPSAVIPVADVPVLAMSVTAFFIVCWIYRQLRNQPL